MKICLIILAVLVALGVIGYIVVNLVFSLFADSFYHSVPVPSPAVTDDGGTEEFDPEAAFKSLPMEKLNLTPEKFKRLMKEISFQDKTAVLSLLSSSLSAEQYKELTSMLSGGITSEEIKKAYEVLGQSLSSEDKEKIWGYYNKYAYLLIKLG